MFCTQVLLIANQLIDILSLPTSRLVVVISIADLNQIVCERRG